MKPLVAVLFSLPFIATTLSAATHTWKGSTTNNLWSYGPNWTSGVAPTAAESGVKLVFPATTHTDTTHDVAGLSVDLFTITGKGYLISGSGGAKLTLSGASNGGLVAAPGDANYNAIDASLPVVLAGTIVTLTNTNGILDIRSVISGPGILVRDGAGSVILSGTAPNTFSGGLFAQGGETQFNKAAGIKAIGSGDIFIGDPLNVGSANVRVVASDQIPDSTYVTLTREGILRIIGSASEKIAGLSLVGAEVSMDSGARLILGGNITVGTGAVDSLIDGPGFLDLGGQTRTITVPPDAAENAPSFGSYGLTIVAPIAQGSAAAGITKTGTGLLRLNGSNTYSGLTAVSEGRVRLANSTAAGNTAGGTIVSSGATVEFETNSIFAEPITLQSGSLASRDNCVLTGSVQLTGICGISSEQGMTLTLSGIVSGTGSLLARPIHAGTIEFAGSQANTFSGYVHMQSGNLRLNKAAGPAIKGDLYINTQVASAAPAKVLHVKTGQLSPQTFVTCGSLITNEWDLNGIPETIAGIAGCTTLKLGTGSLTLAGNFTTAFSGVITGTGPTGIIKNGTGTFTINRAFSGGVYSHSTYTGQSIVNGGGLVINDDQTGAFVINNGGTLSGTGSVGTVAINSGGRLSLGQLKVKGITGSGAGNQIAATITDKVTFEQAVVTGVVNLGSTVFSATVGFEPPLGSSFKLIDNDGVDPVVGTFLGLAEGAAITIGGMPFKISYFGGTGNDVVLIYTGPGPILPKITSIVVNATVTSVFMEATGKPGTSYLWQKSTDLKTWDDLSIGTANAQGALSASFPTGPGNPTRQFYRLVQP